MIVFGFPPRAGSGIQRIVRFVEFLPNYDWEPIILTIPRWGNDISDESWESQIPPVTKIHRVFSLDPMRILLALKSKQHVPEQSTSTSKNANSSEQSLLDKFKNFYHKISIPDSAIWWVPSSILYGMYLIIRYSPDLIYTSSGPYGTSLTGLILKKISGLPWIAEFRDPWIKNPLRKIEPKRLKIEEWMQNACLNNADGIIATTKPTTQEFVKFRTADRPLKSAVITNGFSEGSFKDELQAAKTNEFKIVYTGMFYGERSPEYLFEAVRKCCEANEEFYKSAKVIIAGTLPDKYLRISLKEPFNKIVNVLGYVSHERSLQLLQQADLLYLFLSKKETDIYPAKLFEYLAARKYILAGVPTKGITAEIIHRFKAGKVIETDDVEGMKNSLLECFADHKKGELNVGHSLEDIGEYEWKNITKSLAEFFDGIIKIER